ncbi:lipase esterase [Fusarium tjaetaba]|uniref:Lipase esterase n=1 Tax=Fusarium tjaetaba TaxID=1567544 RepID=A0A8H5SCB8_9HYPO|nr:lipase esterase [Fusarium tjaetaba]KAF5650785.1 lipase esterase [Fusarium tjaetaba]
MTLRYEPEFWSVLEPLVPTLPKREPLSLDNIKAGREAREDDMRAAFESLDTCPDVNQRSYNIETPDSYTISVLALTPGVAQDDPGPCLLHFHGGRMILGSAEIQAKPLAQLVSMTTVPVFSVNYRLAPEFKGTTPVQDSYTALLWLHSKAQEFNINPRRIGVMGESAGGGIAAGVALMARDKRLNPGLAKQVLIYPMIDDCNIIPNKAIEPLAIWKTTDNTTGWAALLGDEAGKPEAVSISYYSAPARAPSLAGLPPIFIDVRCLDIFLQENIKYAIRLLAENIPTELHVYPGLPHGFELIAPNITATKKAEENRYRAILGI